MTTTENHTPIKLQPVRRNLTRVEEIAAGELTIQHAFWMQHDLRDTEAAFGRALADGASDRDLAYLNGQAGVYRKLLEQYTAFGTDLINGPGDEDDDE